MFQIFSAVSAKYYLIWFAVGKVIMKIKRVDFLLRHSVESLITHRTIEGIEKLKHLQTNHIQTYPKRNQS